MWVPKLRGGKVLPTSVRLRIRNTISSGNLSLSQLCVLLCQAKGPSIKGSIPPGHCYMQDFIYQASRLRKIMKPSGSDNRGTSNLQPASMTSLPHGFRVPNSSTYPSASRSAVVLCCTTHAQWLAHASRPHTILRPTQGFHQVPIYEEDDTPC